MKGFMRVYLPWCLQEPYMCAWVNHLRTGLFAVPAHIALLLTINLFADWEAAHAGYNAQDFSTVREARSQQLTLYMLLVLPGALVAGVVLSWLRLRLWVRPVLRKFRCDSPPPLSPFQGLMSHHDTGPILQQHEAAQYRTVRDILVAE